MEEIKMQYILNEYGELDAIPKDKCKPVEYPIKYKLENFFEVFVRIDHTENYWISNYGRCVNNYRSTHKNVSKDKFYEHKRGKCHYTIFEVDRRPKKDRRGRITDEMEVDYYKRETSPEELVVEVFLVKYRNRHKVWHKDGDESNNWYKNLLCVSSQDYADLKAGKVTWQELNLEQEYIEYQNKAGYEPMKTYACILARCNGDDNSDTVHKCYVEADMCQEWRDNPKKFVKWYLKHYYEVPGESMAVDKDLFGNGKKIYSPETCCILPQGLNSMLSNCKKHYSEGKTSDNTLPYGVRYNSKNNKYHGEIQFTGTENMVILSEWDSAEEAFAEYKLMKQANICMVAAKYKQYIPDYIYNKLLTIDVKPY